MDDIHIPVLFDEVIEGLQLRPDGRYIDGTLGGGGHAKAILQGSTPNGRLIAFDQDKDAIAFASQKLAEFGDRVTFVNSSFSNMGQLAPENGFEAGTVDGILLDIGLSSRQLDNPDRGFSFRFDGPLDMRMNQSTADTAADLINNLSADDLADIFWRYGEERHSRRLAQDIVQARPFTTTTQLAEFIANKMPKTRKPQRIHPATRIFQALRIAVNDELGVLETVLPAALKLLKTNGRLCVISFHSLEDRIVKQYLREQSKTCICPPEQPICNCDNQPAIKLVRRKAIKATEAEIAQNARSRSARLRIAEKL